MGYAGPAYITEVFNAQAAGAACKDYNGRAGCGNDDLYIEIYVPAPGASLAGWYMTVTGVGTYRFKTDNLTSPLKVIFADTWFDSLTFPVYQLPNAGTVNLFDQWGILRDTRAYTTASGQSYSAADWHAPTVGWGYHTPSPGY
jgi:hypothetical protein